MFSGYVERGFLHRAAFGVVSLAQIFTEQVVPPGNDLFKSGLYDSLALLVYQMLFIGLTFALFLMVNRWMLYELERDIVTRAKAEEDLKNSELRYRTMVEQAAGGIFISDTTGYYVDVNPRGCAMLRYSRDEILRLRLQDIIPAQDQNTEPPRLAEWLASVASALDIPYCHHEYWDGTGYPRGLKGEGIPLAARLFAVVDVWDAMRSKRPYHSARPEDEVRQHLVDQAGSHFDPQAVELFLDMDIA